MKCKDGTGDLSVLRRKEEAALTESVCSLIEMRGVGMQLTADPTAKDAAEISRGSHKNDGQAVDVLANDSAYDDKSISSGGGV